MAALSFKLRSDFGKFSSPQDIPDLGFTTGDLTSPQSDLPSSSQNILYSYVGHRNSIKRPHKYELYFWDNGKIYFSSRLPKLMLSQESDTGVCTKSFDNSEQLVDEKESQSKKFICAKKGINLDDS